MRSISRAGLCLAVASLMVCQVSNSATGKQQKAMAVEVPQASGVWSSNFETRITMGDGDSKVRVREIALDDLRRQAAAAVGSVVESVSVLKGDKLAEQTKMVTVALVQLDRIKEAVAVDQAGVVSLVVSARATVDATELERRATALRDDGDKASAVARLQVENQSLRHELDQVRAQITKPGLSSEALTDQQNRLIGAIKNNERQVSQVFDAGVLLAMADKEEQRVQRIFDVIDRTVLGPILSSQATAKVVSTSRSGNNLNVGVTVGWDLDLAKIRSALSPYVRVRSGGEGGANYLAITTPDNAEGKEPNDLSRRVLAYLSKNQLNLVVSLAGSSLSVPVMEAIVPDFFRDDRCGFPTKVGGDVSADVCIYRISTASKAIIGFGDVSKRVNPITLTIPVASASGPVSVTTYWQWIDSKGNKIESNPIVAHGHQSY